MSIGRPDIAVRIPDIVQLLKRDQPLQSLRLDGCD